jgi:murein DD-endopeptidase MepM/ murein hydrolase activator NlpD
VSRILICTMLMAMLSGGLSRGPAPLTDVPTRPGPVAQAGLVAQAGPDDVGDKPALRFGWPLPGSPTVVRAFHPPAFRYGPGHRGVDLAAVAGAPVLAAGAGTVVFAGTVAGHGVVSVDHPGGLRTTYEPVSPTVTAGDRVVRGERIGTVQPGHPGCPGTVCLHWGVLGGPKQDPEKDKQYLDPLRLLAAARVRLLPIDGLPGDAGTPLTPGVVSRRRLPASCFGAVAPPGCAAGIPGTQ